LRAFLVEGGLNRVIAIAAAVCKLLCINGLSYACSMAVLACMKSNGWMISIIAWSYLPYQCFATRNGVCKASIAKPQMSGPRQRLLVDICGGNYVSNLRSKCRRGGGRDFQRAEKGRRRGASATSRTPLERARRGLPCKLVLVDLRANWGVWQALEEKNLHFAALEGPLRRKKYNIFFYFCICCAPMLGRHAGAI